MFFKWLREQILYCIIGFGAIYVLFHTGGRTSAVVGGPGNYTEGWVVLTALGIGFLLATFGSFTKRKNGSMISGLGIIILICAVLWIWK